MVYETYTDAGHPVKTGNLIYASLNGKAPTRSFYFASHHRTMAKQITSILNAWLKR